MGKRSVRQNTKHEINTAFDKLLSDHEHGRLHSPCEYTKQTDTLKAIAMNKIYYITALLNTGHPEEAEALLMENGGLEVPQLREGEGSLSNLYTAIQCAKAEKQGIKLDPEKVEVPKKIDFRMDHISE